MTVRFAILGAGRIGQAAGRAGESIVCDGDGHRPTMAGYGGGGLRSDLPVGRGDGCEA